MDVGYPVGCGYRDVLSPWFELNHLEKETNRWKCDRHCLPGFSDDLIPC